MSIELVPADNMQTLAVLTPQAREAAVTHMLTEARAWLAHAVESTDPHSIAEFKAQMATVAEATKQLNLSKEIQLDALEMVRRAERGVGLAIRKGQAEGTVLRQGQVRVAGGGFNEVPRVTKNFESVSPADLATTNELTGQSGQQNGIYALTDGVSDEQFENAIDAAKDEGNLSRANVVRKVRDVQDGTVETREMRSLRIQVLAEQGHTREAIAKAIGVNPQTVTNIAKDYGINIPADSVMRRKRRADSDELLERAALALESVANSITFVNPEDLSTGEETQERIDSLTQSINALRKATNRIKESLHVQA